MDLPGTRLERQLHLLMHVLRDYRAGRTRFYAVVSDVGALISELDGEIGEDRVEDLRTERGTLEVILALMTAEERQVLNSVELEQIGEVVDRLEELATGLEPLAGDHTEWTRG